MSGEAMNEADHIQKWEPVKFYCHLDASETSSMCQDNGHMPLQITLSHASFSIWLPDIIMNKDGTVIPYVAHLVAGDFKS